MLYPLFESVPAGLPFTPETETRSEIDLDSYLIEHPASTYLVRVKGDSMCDAGILEGDIVLVDKTREAKDRDIIIASLDGEVTLKYLEKRASRVRLIPANQKYEPIGIRGNLEILGVIVGLVRKYH